MCSITLQFQCCLCMDYWWNCVWLLCAIVDHERIVSRITAWGIQWTGLPHSPKTWWRFSNQRQSGPLLSDSVTECWQLKPEALGSIPGGTTFLSFPLLFQRSSDSNVPDCLWLDDLYWFSDCGGVPSIRLPMLWLRSPSYHALHGLVWNAALLGPSGNPIPSDCWPRFPSLLLYGVHSCCTYQCMHFCST